MKRAAVFLLLASCASPQAVADDPFCAGVELVRREANQDTPFVSLWYAPGSQERLARPQTPAGWDGATCKENSTGSASQLTCAFVGASDVSTRFAACALARGAARAEVDPDSQDAGSAHYRWAGEDRVVYVTVGAANAETIKVIVTGLE